MKKIIILLTLAVFSASCDEEIQDVSRVTNYPNFELIGDEVIFVPKGGEYIDAGVIVTENGETIDHTVSISGAFQGESSVNTNVDDIYTITYSAVNQDGYAGSATRTVIVAETGDFTTSIAGLYRSNVQRNASPNMGASDWLEYLLIWDNGDGTFTLTDGIGGYYALFRGYGNGYAAPADIIANDIPGNSFTVEEYSVGTFGGTVSASGFSINPTARTISFNASWDQGYTFAVTLEQVQF